MVEIVSATAVWNHPGRRVPTGYVLVRDPERELRPQAFLCTDLDADPLDILRWFIRRWSIEVTFADVRRHLSVWRPKGNGPNRPSPAPRQSCSACFP
jgi:hypothetical protein